MSASANSGHPRTAADRAPAARRTRLRRPARLAGPRRSPAWLPLASRCATSSLRRGAREFIAARTCRCCSGCRSRPTCSCVYLRALRWRHLTLDPIQPIETAPLFRAVWPSGSWRTTSSRCAWARWCAPGTWRARPERAPRLHLRDRDPRTCRDRHGDRCSPWPDRWSGSGAAATGGSLAAGRAAAAAGGARCGGRAGLVCGRRRSRPCGPRRLPAAAGFPERIREYVLERLEQLLRPASEGWGLCGGSHLFWIGWSTPCDLARRLDHTRCSPAFARPGGRPRLAVPEPGGRLDDPRRRGHRRGAALRPGLLRRLPLRLQGWCSRGFGLPAEMAVALGTLLHAVFWLSLTGSACSCCAAPHLPRRARRGRGLGAALRSPVKVALPRADNPAGSQRFFRVGGPRKSRKDRFWPMARRRGPTRRTRGERGSAVNERIGELLVKENLLTAEQLREGPKEARQGRAPRSADHPARLPRRERADGLRRQAVRRPVDQSRSSPSTTSSSSPATTSSPSWPPKRRSGAASTSTTTRRPLSKTSWATSTTRTSTSSTTSDDVDAGELARGLRGRAGRQAREPDPHRRGQEEASDIHIEPYEKTFRVRYRIDGVLYEVMKPPMKLKNAITSRVKIMSELDIAERRLPQDGRIKLKMGRGKEMDFRVSVLPTLFGEKIVLRLLDKSNLQLDMTKLGFEQPQLDDFKDSIHQPYGMVLVTGPTGSGKTTTLYSALSELNKDQREPLHRRGSRSSSTSGHQPGADARGHRPELRGGPALLPASGPRHHHGR